MPSLHVMLQAGSTQTLNTGKPWIIASYIMNYPVLEVCFISRHMFHHHVLDKPAFDTQINNHRGSIPPSASASLHAAAHH
jgi:hypothetical protein